MSTTTSEPVAPPAPAAPAATTNSFKELLNHPVVILVAALLGSGAVGGSAASLASSQEVQAVQDRVVALEARVVAAEKRDEKYQEDIHNLHVQVVEIKADVKAILRLQRSMVHSSSVRITEGDTRDP